MARGGRRPGAGRPRIDEEGCSWQDRAVSKTVTLPARMWEDLELHATDGRASTAIKGMYYFITERPANGDPVPGWNFAADLRRRFQQ